MANKANMAINEIMDPLFILRAEEAEVKDDEEEDDMDEDEDDDEDDDEEEAN